MSSMSRTIFRGMERDRIGGNATGAYGRAIRKVSAEITARSYETTGYADPVPPTWWERVKSWFPFKRNLNSPTQVG